MRTGTISFQKYVLLFLDFFTECRSCQERDRKSELSIKRFARLLHVIAQRRLLILGIACNAVSFFFLMALVQTEPLSFALPASSASFVLETLLAKFVLHERLGPRRTAGALAVLAGVVLVGG
jgi:drug/metabolite transporter (DMT)-like permease